MVVGVGGGGGRQQCGNLALLVQERKKRANFLIELVGEGRSQHMRGSCCLWRHLKPVL